MNIQKMLSSLYPKMENRLKSLLGAAFRKIIFIFIKKLFAFNLSVRLIGLSTKNLKDQLNKTIVIIFCS